MANTFIAKLDNYARLGSADRILLRQIAAEHLRTFHAREDIIREGDKPEAINLVMEGWAYRYKSLQDGRRQIVSFFLPGDLCDLNVFVLQQMDHSIGAITPVTISEISRAGFEQLMTASPRVRHAMWWESLVAMAIQREWVINLGQRDALERLAHLICEIYLRLRTVGLTTGNSFEFPLTQTELADAMGLSAVHVNRTLQELRAANLIVLKNKTATVPDFDALASAALFDANYLHLDHEGAQYDANEP
jgi:CRP-like cAMP-binding protein